MEYDIIIIGAGVVGAATARELSRWKLRTAVLEAKDDVACGTTKANSAIVHSGHSTKPGSLMAKYNVRGNRLYKGICDELDVPFLRNTHLMIGFSDDDIPRLQKVYDDGVANGVTGLKMLTRDETLALEPNLNPEITGSLLAETGAIVCPYELTIALAENANINGVEFHFNSKVTGVKRREDGKYEIMLADGRSFVSRAVLNAAGVHSDAINNFVSERKLQIIPRIGEYWMLDKNYASAFKATIFQVPGPMGKGILVSPTVDGTVLLGPTAKDVEDADDVSTTGEGLKKVLEIAGRTWPHIPRGAAITTFAGIRAHLASHDFVLGEAEDSPMFFNAAGIESPGLTSAPAIAEDLAAEIADKLHAIRNDAYRPGRPPVRRFRHMTNTERATAIAENPAFARIICRCETVTEAEIRDAICRPLGARSVDAIKRRTRAGMGRCQSGFCLPRVMEILSEELGMPINDITKFGGESKVIVGELYK